MDHSTGVGISQRLTVKQRLAIEKQLLREEKYIVHALKTVKEERYGLQREGTDLLCLLQEVMRQGKSNTGLGQKQAEATAEQTIIPATSVQPADLKEPVAPTSSLPDDFYLDDVVNNDLELNLTVPSHHFYDQMPEEEFEEIETEDDFEIEMSMLMNGGKPN